MKYLGAVINRHGLDGHFWQIEDASERVYQGDDIYSIGGPWNVYEPHDTVSEWDGHPIGNWEIGVNPHQEIANGNVGIITTRVGGFDYHPFNVIVSTMPNRFSMNKYHSSPVPI